MAQLGKRSFNMLERVAFVCQAGELEAQAVLLAASLRSHFPAGLKLIAAHPRLHGALRQTVVKALRDLEVEIATIENPLDKTYLIGHKLAALELLGGSGVGMFLDTDILVMRPPDPHKEALPGGLAAVPASGQICSLATWQHIYARFDLAFPQAAPPTLNTRETTAPYFNSGMIAVPGAIANGLAASWVDSAMQIDNDPAIPAEAKRPYLDQTSLPIAAARLGHAITALKPKWNFPSWLGRIPEKSSPIFFHYQRIARLLRQMPTQETARAALALSPSAMEAFQQCQQEWNIRS